MSQEMLVNVSEDQECRVAVVENGSLEELYIERASLVSHVGNIYKGKVVNIEPGIQAAFVDFGLNKNGFLHISDLHPRYFRGKKETAEKIGRRKSVNQRPQIQKVLSKGQDIIVQVTKEGINTKGPTLTTYISLPGKYLVLMPWMAKMGVSQKIEDEEERKRLREMMDDFDVPENCGLIIRTAAQGATKRELQNDAAYLKRLWSAIRKRLDKTAAPCEIYQESDLVIRTVRDVFSTKIRKIVCDSEQVTKRIRDFLGIVQPRLKRRATHYDGKTPLFHKYKIEEEIEKIQGSHVALKSGGSLVIEPTEALVAIDVNSGRYRKQDNAEQTALKINLEAAKEIVRQLKLRDLGGLIICDFIDMREVKNRREVEKVFRDELRKDRARSRALRMSAFGLIELTRQRVGPSLQSSTYLECPHCGGSGVIKSMESQSIEIIRLLNVAAARNDVKQVEITVAPPVADFLQNKRRALLASLEVQSDKSIEIRADQNKIAHNWELVCYNKRGSLIKL
ncbi:MAG: Rne/Rng family ribonuclease [Sedimentisphaerales bacterium]|nr:Rne/Rng family ribonuclease [Sedimentisphaerales bacterium]